MKKVFKFFSSLILALVALVNVYHLSLRVSQIVPHIEQLILELAFS